MEKFLSLVITGSMLFVGLGLSSYVASGCDGDSGSDADYNHTFQIHNGGVNDDCIPRQFVRVVVSPTDTDDSSTTISQDFVSSAGDNTDVRITIPGTGIYKILFYTVEDYIIWWDSIALDVGGTTGVDLHGEAGSYGYSFIEEIAPDGCYIPCDDDVHTDV